MEEGGGTEVDHVGEGGETEVDHAGEGSGTEVDHAGEGGGTEVDHAGEGGESFSEGNDSGQEVEHELGLILITLKNEILHAFNHLTEELLRRTKMFKFLIYV